VGGRRKEKRTTEKGPIRGPARFCLETSKGKETENLK